MNEETIFCGSGKAHTFPSGGQKISISLDLSTIGAMFKAHGFTTEQGKKMIKLDVVEKKGGPDQYGKTHFVAIDQWKPNQQQQGQYSPQQGNAIAPEFQQSNNNGQSNKQNGQQLGNPQQFNSNGYKPPSGPMNNQYEDDVPF